MNVSAKHSEHPKRLSKTARVAVASFVGLFSLFSCAVVLVHQPTWPATIAVSAELIIVATFCWVVLRHD